LFSSINLYDIAKWIEKDLSNLPKLNIKGISTDSRNIKEGEIFIALKGDYFDGHDFIYDAISKGALGVICEKEIEADIPVFIVNDSLSAMVSIAKNIRKFFNGKVFAITGSAGKSSTKAWLGSLLGDFTLIAPASFNNLIGVSKTIFMLKDDTKNLVLEMGMNAPKEILTLCENFSPQGGLITNIGDAHVGKLGNLHAVYSAKKELFDWLSSSNQKLGIALNIDDKKVVRAYNESFKIKPPTISYSCKEKNAQVFISSCSVDPSSGFLKLEINLPNSSKNKVNIPVFGLFHSYNIAAAISGALLMGENEKNILNRLETLKPQTHRGQIFKAGTITIIDESYNSNPTALRLSLETLFKMELKKRMILVLGDMLELGEYSEKLHEEIADLIVNFYLKSGLKLYVIGVGNIMKKIFPKLKETKIPVYLVSNALEALEHLNKIKAENDLIFIKGSRKNALDTIIDKILIDP